MASPARGERLYRKTELEEQGVRRAGLEPGRTFGDVRGDCEKVATRRAVPAA